MNITNTSYLKPTVSEVEKVLNGIADKYALGDFKEVHKIIGVSDRTLRRWRAKADREPLNPSNIPTLASLAIFSIHQGFLLTQNYKSLTDQIPKKYLMTANNYICPPADFLKSLVGKNNILGMTIKELASLLHVSHVQLGADIKREKLSYLTFSAILMICGFSPCQVFGLNDNAYDQVLRERGKINNSQSLEFAISSEIKGVINYNHVAIMQKGFNSIIATFSFCKLQFENNSVNSEEQVSLIDVNGNCTGSFFLGYTSDFLSLKEFSDQNGYTFIEN